MKKIPVLLLFLAVFTPFFAHAETVLRIGESVAVEADQVVEGDYYVSVGPTGSTNMSGSVSEDMYAFGGSVTANGSIGKDLTIVSGVSQVHATVTDDVRILSGEVTLAEHVGGDLFVIAGKLNVLSSASVDGDIIFFGGEADIAGTVGGSILGAAERMRIDAKVAGDVDVKAVSSLAVGERASIEGAVTYTSSQSLTRAQNASISGEVIHNVYKKTVKEKDAKESLIPVFISLFAALTLFLLFKKELQSLVVHTHSHPLKSGLIGLLVIVVAPVVSLLLIATILGMFVGLVGLAFVLFAYVLGFALSGVVVGAFIAKLVTKKLQVTLLWILVGTFVLHAFLFIPIVGVPLMLIVFALTVGAVSISTYKILS